MEKKMKEATAKETANNGRKKPMIQLQGKESQFILEKILDKLEKIEQKVSRLEHVVNQAPEALTFATNFVDEAAARVQENGQNLEDWGKILVKNYNLTITHKFIKPEIKDLTMNLELTHKNN